MGIVVFWDMMPCSLVDSTSVLKGCAAFIYRIQSVLYSSLLGSTFLLNVNEYVPEYVTSVPENSSLQENVTHAGYEVLKVVVMKGSIL
jgi:glycosyltransferase A (GT-A) superfamily protein (DUF2064 family)